MPPHSSHLLQPLDVVRFSPLKTAFSTQNKDLTRNHIFHVRKEDFLATYYTAFLTTFTTKKWQVQEVTWDRVFAFIAVNRLSLHPSNWSYHLVWWPWTASSVSLSQLHSLASHTAVPSLLLQTYSHWRVRSFFPLGSSSWTSSKWPGSIGRP